MRRTGCGRRPSAMACTTTSAFTINIAEAYTTFGGRCWILARQDAFATSTHLASVLTDHQGRVIHNVRHVFTTSLGQPWWSLPVRPAERAYQLDPATSCSPRRR